MSKSVNQVTILGNVGRDPELQTGKSGKVFLRLSVATTRGVKDANGQWEDKTDWHRVTFFDKAAEAAASFLKKGDRVYVNGRLTTDEFMKDGVKSYSTYIIANDWVPLGEKHGNNNRAAVASPAAVNDADDTPF